MLHAGLVLLIAAVLPAAAQLQQVDVQVSGLNCASCAGAVAKRLGRLRGVTSAAFDADKGVASVVLAQTNTVTLDVVRDTLKNLGYTPGDAAVKVRGVLREGVLSLPHQEAAFTVARAESEGAVRVEGSVAAASKELKARSVTRE